MYESWFLKQKGSSNDLFHSDFEIFGILKPGFDESAGKTRRLVDSELIPWMSTKISTGSLKLLLTRHRQHLHHEFKPECTAFDRGTFEKVSRLMNIPRSYLFVRANLGGSGAFQRYSTLTDDGTVSQLGFVIRVPHSPRNDEKAVWSVAVAWDKATSITTALFESVSDYDIRDIEEYMTAEASKIGHPLFLPVMLLDLLVMFYIDHRKELQFSLFSLESQLGITRGQRSTDVWSWDFDLHRETTKHCDGVYTGLVYLERRLEFALGLCDFILECLDYCKEENALDTTNFAHLARTSKLLKETVCNHRNLVKTQLQQAFCLQKRCQALTTVLATVISQQNSNTNTKLAQAAKQDSTVMTGLSFLGMIFLPASLVASIFSTSMFNFWPDDGTSSSSKKSIIAPDFWIYWAVAVPLTLTVMVTGRYWMLLQAKKSGQEWESLKTERIVAGQSWYTTGDSALSPMYPRKS